MPNTIKCDQHKCDKLATLMQWLPGCNCSDECPDPGDMVYSCDEHKDKLLFTSLPIEPIE